MTRNGLFQAFMGTSSRKSENPGYMGAGAALTDRGAAIKIIDDNGGFEK